MSPERLLGDVHLQALGEPFGTAELPDEVVDQRIVCTMYVSANDGGPRRGKWGLFVWMDRGGPDDGPWTPEPSSYRGQNGAGLTPAERRYLAASLYAKAKRLLETADEP